MSDGLIYREEQIGKKTFTGVGDLEAVTKMYVRVALADSSREFCMLRLCFRAMLPVRDPNACMGVLKHPYPDTRI